MENKTSQFDGMNVLSLENPAFGSYIICVCLLALKMMGVTLLTISHRMKRKMFISSEDAVWFKGQVASDESIDRARRAYLNDLEMIPMFFIIGLLYLWTRPSFWVVTTLYFIFLITRVLHTFVYAVVVIPQPTRAILFLIGFFITGYMAIHTAIHAFIHLVS